METAGDWNQDSGFRLAQQLISHPDPPDALVCASDDLAAGAILGLSELGLKVPNDIAIVGFDDRPFAAHLPIPLTTVALPLVEMGELAAQAMFAAISGEPVANELTRVPCRLVVRASCGSSETHDRG
jgi:LacI family transcriptional regulator